MIAPPPEKPSPFSTEGIALAIGQDDSLRPFLAFETMWNFYEQPQESPDLIDVVVSGYLEAGFALLSGPLGSQQLPAVDGWAIKADALRITIWDEDGTIVYTAPTEDVAQEWIDLLNDQSSCNVVTGTGLGVETEEFTDQIAGAISSGRVVGARIALADAQREHPKT